MAWSDFCLWIALILSLRPVTTYSQLTKGWLFYCESIFWADWNKFWDEESDPFVFIELKLWIEFWATFGLLFAGSLFYNEVFLFYVKFEFFLPVLIY